MPISTGRCKLKSQKDDTYTTRMSVTQKKTASVSEDVKKLKPSYSAGKNVRQYSHWKSLSVPRKAKHSYHMTQHSYSLRN